MAQQQPRPIQAAQAASIFLATTAGGANLASSFFLIPRLLESPTPLMLRQWARGFEAAKVPYPAAAGLAGLAYFYLAHHFRRGGGAGGGGGGLRSGLYLAAGALCVGIMPYTWAVIWPTNRKLFRKVEETRLMLPTEESVEEAGAGAREETAKYLVDHWGLLNLGRGVMLSLGGLLGLAASL